jgi:hypothetical protein
VTRLEDAVDQLIDVIEACSPMWRYTLICRDPRRAPVALQPLSVARLRLAQAVCANGFGLDEAHAAVVDAAQGMTAAARQTYVQTLYRPEMPTAPEIDRYWNALAAVLAATDHESKESRS